MPTLLNPSRQDEKLQVLMKETKQTMDPRRVLNSGIKPKAFENKNDESPYQVYFDIDFKNTASNDPQFVNFQVARSAPLLLNPSNYFLSIIRFNLDTDNVPKFLAEALVDGVNTDPNKLIYSFTLNYTDVSGNEYNILENMQFIPQDLSIVAPSLPFSVYDPALINNEYYYVYSYNQVIKMMNNTLQIAFSQLQTDVSNNGNIAPTNVPFLNLDPNNYLITLYSDISGGVSIFMNNDMNILLSSFETIYYGSNVPLGKNFEIEIYNKNNLNIETVNGVDYYTMVQEFPSIPLWSGIENFTWTTSININGSNINPPIIYTGNGIATGATSNSSLNIISDFQIGLDKGYENFPTINYAPTSEFRLIDILASGPLTSFNLQCYWKDKNGNYRRMLLPKGTGGSIKILFRRKAFDVPELKYLMDNLE